MGSSSSRRHDPRCAILTQGLDAKGTEYTIRAWYAGWICCGMSGKMRCDLRKVEYLNERRLFRLDVTMHGEGVRKEWHDCWKHLQPCIS